MCRPTSLLIVFCAFIGSACVAQLKDTQEVRFNRDVRPILARSCFPCHGPDPASRQAGLRFDREEDLFSPREDGAPIVRSRPDESGVMRRVTSSDPSTRMPPPNARQTLSPADRDLLRRWITEGASFEPHWSFIPPVQPSLPEVQDAEWPRQDWDRFVLARLEKEGINKAPEASKPELLRRVSLDLRGLPPTRKELETFLNDTDQNAYEHAVDRFLASPRYGEHRARAWLDAARYADTHGLHFDNFRDIWPYRDWVISAINTNMPFDQFTIEQLAGDLLESPRLEQLVATGFHRCAMSTNEGGTIAEENFANYARERVETTAAVWLGLTAGCAACHEHKFDPISQKDFYALSAFFRNTTEKDKDGNIRDTPPVLPLPAPEDLARWREIPKELAKLQDQATARTLVLEREFDAWLKSATMADWEHRVLGLGVPELHLPFRLDVANDSVIGTLSGTPTVLHATGPIPWKDGSPHGPAPELSQGATLLLEGDVGDFDRDTAFSYGGWLRIPEDGEGSGAVLARMDEQDHFRGWDLWVQGREFGAHLIHRWKSDALKVVTTGGRRKPGTWQHVMVTHDGSGRAEGYSIYVDGAAAPLAFEANALRSTCRTASPLRVGQRSQGAALRCSVQDLRIYRRALLPKDVATLSALPAARRLLGSKDRREGPDREVLRGALLNGDEVLAQTRAKTKALEEERQAIRQRAPVAYVMEERDDGSPMAHVLDRGAYDQPRARVGAAVFQSLHPFPTEAPRNRLGLARWIVARDNPLTARVIVNRAWQEVFGTGLVATPDDFGIMGAAPSYPELLDHLALRLQASGWDMKALFRTLVLSATYRQSSVASEGSRRRDPDNRLLSRGPRFRMDGEMLRDLALFVSGLLSPRVGGPSVKPYQPSGVWEAVSMPESNTKTYQRGLEGDLHRRSLYTFWKRHAPPPSLVIFDAPSREVSCVRRERTNTPLQALVTLNDPQYVEASRVLAEALLSEFQEDDRRLQEAALRILSREFSERERVLLCNLLERLRGHYAKHQDDAAALVAVGQRPAAKIEPSELAAWTVACNQLLNLDEALCK